MPCARQARYKACCMKKPTATLLYPGVVLRSSGMVIIPQVPKARSRTVRLPVIAKSSLKNLSATSSRRK